MPLPGSYKIFSSSAGSGKTFTLVKNYLRICLEGDTPWYFKHVLAITFTNDAALEMKSRVIEALKRFSSKVTEEEQSKDHLRQILQKEIGLNNEAFSIKSQQVYRYMLQDYADVHIRTIDSFTNQLSQTFALDLNMPYKYEITLDQTLHIQQAVESVFSFIGQPKNEFLTELIEKLAEDKVEEGKSWQQVMPDLASFVSESLQDKNYRLVKKNKNLNSQEILEITEKIQNYLNTQNFLVKNLGQKAIEKYRNAGLTPNDFKYGERGPIAFFNKLTRTPYLLFTDTKIVGVRIKKVAADPSEWFSKKDTEKNQFKDLCQALTAITQEALDLLLSQQRKYKTLFAINKEIHNLAMVNLVSKEYFKLLMAKNYGSLSDINQKISEIVANEPIPYIFERLGENFRHILIDEFQDTSDLQYFNLIPLINNALSSRFFNMIVGDPKQSIYRWRGGKAELMIHLMNKETQPIIDKYELNNIQDFNLKSTSRYIQKENLENNFRSASEIVNFNNGLFDFIAKSSTNKILKKAYENIHQHSSKDKTEGHVELIFLPQKLDDVKLNKEETLAKSFERTVGLIEKNLSLGYNFDDIAVLVRKNKHATLLAEILKAKNWPIKSADALLLSSNISIILVHAAAKAIHEPQNIFAQQEAMSLWYRFSKKPLSDLNTTFTSFVDFANTIDIALDPELLPLMGVSQVYEYLMKQFGMFEQGNDLPYLFTLLDEIAAFDALPNSGFHDWWQHWLQKKGKLSLSPKKGNAITISSIHKSKGLEYPLVIIPDADWSTKPKSTSKIWLTTEELTYPELESNQQSRLHAAYVPLSSKLLGSDFEATYTEELAFNELEEVNILYVALTRPTQSLYVISTGKDIGEQLKSFAEDLNNERIDNSDAEVKVLVSTGLPPQAKKPSEAHESYLLEEIKSVPNFGKIAQQSKLAKLYQGGSPIQIGNLIHLLFSRMKKSTDLQDTLRVMTLEGHLDENLRKVLEMKVSETLKNKEIKNIFDTEGEVINERDLINKEGKILRPDRLILDKRETIVIDFKTGQKMTSHQKQIKTYGKVLREMNMPNVRQVLIYVENGDYQEVS